MSNGMVVANKYASPDPTEHLMFGQHEKDIKRRDTSNYVLVAAGSNTLRRWVLNPMTGDFSSEGCNLGAQQRDYTDIVFSPDGEFFYAATTTGDFICVQTRSLIMRSINSVCSGGVKSLCVLPGGELVAGGGDGSITLFSGRGDALVDDRRTYIAGAVNAVSCSADGGEILAGPSHHQLLPYMDMFNTCLIRV